jgi:ubiquitin C-terminal hydrolase
MTDILIPCVVENGFNTCYIDSLLVSLFYKNNDNLLNILETTPIKPEAIYLQEIIKLKFVKAIQRNYSITSCTMNEIRNYSIICGWSQDGDIDGQKECYKFYNFIANLFNVQPIEFEILEIKDNILTNNLKKISLPYISLNLTRDDNIKNLLSNWINSELTNNNTVKHIYNCYKLINIPQFIIININRADYHGKRNNYKLDIMKRIKLFGISDTSQNYLKWKIHSIICHRGENYNSGHYYSIIANQKKWLLFDDNLIPSFQQIELEDTDIRDQIMLESVMLVYVLE